eukprot:102254-Amphidinium_carterae.1
MRSSIDTTQLSASAQEITARLQIRLNGCLLLRAAWFSSLQGGTAKLQLEGNIPQPESANITQQKPFKAREQRLEMGALGHMHCQGHSKIALPESLAVLKATS